MLYICILFEGVCATPVILATVRGEGRLRAAGRYIVLPESGGSAGLPDEFQIVQIICFYRKSDSGDTPVHFVLCVYYLFFHTHLI